MDVILNDKDGVIEYFENVGSVRVPVFAARPGTDNPFENGLNYRYNNYGKLEAQKYAHVTFVDLNNDGYLEVAIGSHTNAVKDEEFFAIFELQLEVGTTFMEGPNPLSSNWDTSR